MQVKVLEVRDRATYFPVVCVDMQPNVDHIEPLAKEPAERVKERLDRYQAQSYHLRRQGYPLDGTPNIAMFHAGADGKTCWNDPHGWCDRTHQTAHNYIIDHWADLKDGDVIDVEFILGETTAKKPSERTTVIV